MKKYKAFLTMEITADVTAKDEDSTREALRRAVTFNQISGYSNGSFFDVKNIEVKRYWGGGKEMVQNEQK